MCVHEVIQLIITDVPDSIITGVLMSEVDGAAATVWLNLMLLSFRILFLEFTPTFVDLCGTLLEIMETFLLTKNSTSPWKTCPPDTSMTEYTTVSEPLLFLLYDLVLFFLV